jgi:3-methyladenine DNA glycosylase/8-oxoguanine DNA glycosylase
MSLVRVGQPVDLALTLGPLRRGPRDRSFVVDGAGTWLAMRTPEGIATLRIVARTRSGEVSVRAWGPGDAWAVAQAPLLLGAADDASGFAPSGKLAELHRRFPGLRFARTGRVLDVLVPTIFEQKVSGKEAQLGYADLLRRWGEPAPGPKSGPELLAPPAPETLARLPYTAFHEIGVEKRRADTVRLVARRAARMEEASAMPAPAARARLEAIAGVGPWTSGMVALHALGDADAVPAGDYHLPNMVVFAFTGRARGVDAEMLELLAPYAGHRGRVLRLLMAGGIAAPRFGPRRAFRRIGRM